MNNGSHDYREYTVSLAHPVTVYTKPHCHKCELTKRLLEDYGIPYQTVDILANPDVIDTIQGYGYASLPIVVYTDWEHAIVDFQPDQIERLAMFYDTGSGE